MFVFTPIVITLKIGGIYLKSFLELKTANLFFYMEKYRTNVIISIECFIV